MFKYSLLFLLLTLPNLQSQNLQQKMGYLFSGPGDVIVLYFTEDKKTLHPLSFPNLKELEAITETYTNTTSIDSPYLKVLMECEEIPANEPASLGAPLKVHKIELRE
jgi:hypothetical protein